MRTILTHRKAHEAIPFEAVIGRSHLFAVDVWGTLWKLYNWQEMAGQTLCYWENNSVAFTPVLMMEQHANCVSV